MEEDDDKGFFDRLTERAGTALTFAFKAYGSLLKGDMEGFQQNGKEYAKTNSSILRGDSEKQKPETSKATTKETNPGTGEREAANVEHLETRLRTTPMAGHHMGEHLMLQEQLKEARAEFKEVCGEPEDVKPQKATPATGERETANVEHLEARLGTTPMAGHHIGEHLMLREQLQGARNELREVCGEQEGMQLEEAFGKSNAVPSAAPGGTGPIRQER